MTKCWKLTDKNLRTHGGHQWVLGKPAEPLKGSTVGGLCSGGWYHAYSHPALAGFLNCVHATFDRPRFFEADGTGEYLDDKGLKCGFTGLTLVKELPFVRPTAVQSVAFSILCALSVPQAPGFVSWARQWLDGTDRLVAAAEAARSVAAETAAAWAAWAAADAAAAAAAAARAAETAADAAAWAAAAAAWSAVGGSIDFGQLAQHALENY